MKVDVIQKWVSGAYSGKKALQYVRGLYRFSRWITSPEYEKSAEYCCELMRRLGLDDVELMRFPSDGRRFYGSWRSPRYWAVRRAYLQVKIRRKWVTMADYCQVPTSVFLYSAPTRGEVHTWLVNEDAEDAKGKLIFCGNLARKGLASLYARQARGVVTDFAPDWPGVRGPLDFRKGHRWDNSFLFDDRKDRVGFSLSRDQGELIRAELEESGALECRYRIDGRLGDGEMSVATGCIRGASVPSEEVVIVAHLYEPGANDNCSGVAGSIEALRSIRELIRTKKLEQPARTIRVVFAFEIVGFLAYFQRDLKLGKRYVGGVNPDMIGEDHRLCRSVLYVYQTPQSVSSFTDPLLLHMVERSAGRGFKFESKHFIVNDNSVSDPAIGVPCPALIHLRDQFYHSNVDSPDKVSARTLHTVGGAMAAYAYAVANLGQKDAVEAAGLCLRWARMRLRKEAAGGLCPDRARHLTACEHERLATIERLTGAELGRFHKELDAVAGRVVRIRKPAAKSVPGRLAREARSLVPVRTVIGPLTADHVPLDKRAKLPFNPTWSGALNLALFWADGKRSVQEIYERAMHESPGVWELDAIVRYFKFLKQQNLIALKRKRC